VLRVPIFHGLEKWEMMEIVARTLANGLPDETHWMVTWVVAKWKLNGDEIAAAILGDYIPALPKHGMTHFALGKLAFSMGDNKTASAFFKRAFTVGPELRVRALDDVELDRSWEGLEEAKQRFEAPLSRRTLAIPSECFRLALPCAGLNIRHHVAFPSPQYRLRVRHIIRGFAGCYTALLWKLNTDFRPPSLETPARQREKFDISRRNIQDATPNSAAY
jgi:hypothetical protein